MGKGCHVQSELKMPVQYKRIQILSAYRKESFKDLRCLGVIASSFSKYEEKKQRIHNKFKLLTTFYFRCLLLSSTGVS